LERLIDDGRVHRLESLSAFVVCGCNHGHNAAMFSICSDCGRTEEIADVRLQKDIQALASHSGFRLSHSVVEMHGRCRRCTS